MLKNSYDYEKDSEDYLEEEIPRLQKLLKSDQDCEVDSSDKSEKYCYVVKDEEETGFFFDAMMK